MLRIFTASQQARGSVKGATNCFRSQLRIELYDGITLSRLPALLALCRKEELEIEIWLLEVPLLQQIKGLPNGPDEVGFAQTDTVNEVSTAEEVWHDALKVAAPTHPAQAQEVLHPPISALRSTGLQRLCSPGRSRSAKWTWNR